MNIFLLSPANLSGTRARQMISPRAMSAAGIAYRSPEGVRIADAFTFMSALYFRGKHAYAREFAKPHPGIGETAFVIAPGYGLVSLDWRLDKEKMKRLARTKIDVRSRAYTTPLRRCCRELEAKLSAGDIVVLLGSVASGKYVDVLEPIFGPRLRFPKIFAGMGDMQRGSVMLKAAAAKLELEYVDLTHTRHRPKEIGGAGETLAESSRHASRSDSEGS